TCDSSLYYSSSASFLYNTSFLFFFFFQAEDGIRDRNVTGVQTCALPISATPPLDGDHERATRVEATLVASRPVGAEGCGDAVARSEERRVGKECRSRGWA